MTPTLRERLLNILGARKIQGYEVIDWDRRELNAELDALFSEALAAGWKLTPREPGEGMKQAGKEKMPVESRYWQENGFLHCEMLSPDQCIQPESVWQAMHDKVES